MDVSQEQSPLCTSPGSEHGGSDNLKSAGSEQKDKTRKWLSCVSCTPACTLACLLRFSLFSPLKWKEDACWISFLHLFVFMLHMTKIGCLTALIFRIGNCRADVYKIENNRYIALHHTLLENWDSGYETLPYPPSHGPFAVYTVDDLRSGINYTVSQFYNAEIEAIGNFKRTKNDSLTVIIQYYELFPVPEKKNKTKIVKQSSSFKPQVGLSNYTNKDGQTLYTYNISKDLIANNLQEVLKMVFEVNLTFTLHAVRVDEDDDNAVCHQIQGNVSFHDRDQDGMLLLELKTKDLLIKCADLGFSVKDSHQCDDDATFSAKLVKGFAIATVSVDILTFGLGLFVLIFTSVYIWRHYQNIYQPLDSNEKNLPCGEYLRNVQWWLLFSIIGDIFTLIGIQGILKEEQRFDVQLWKLDRDVVYLGYGYLLTLFSSLRFLRISHKFSVLFKTVWRSASDVLFFLVCVLILFVGFWLSSFIVLGPYHIKFKSKSTSAETLFSIINGDEIYATFAVLQDTYSGDNVGIRTFSRVIVYVYVSLFTVLVFNLLIALFNNAYEAVKESYEAEKEVRPLVTALRNYINYKKNSNIDNGFSEGIRTLLDSRGPLNKAETEMRSILRNYLLPRDSEDELPDVELRERSLFFFMCSDLKTETQNIQEKNCCCCITSERSCVCSLPALLCRMFVKCKCRIPDNSSRPGTV